MARTRKVNILLFIYDNQNFNFCLFPIYIYVFYKQYKHLNKYLYLFVSERFDFTYLCIWPILFSSFIY